ncbi:MAG: MFS transporter [Methylococcales bacterium]
MGQPWLHLFCFLVAMETKESALTPFKYSAFRLFWFAALISNIGTWMNSVAASWLMVDLRTSPLTVALVQSATTLPFLLLALPAGALADIIDRRKLIIIVNMMMMSAAAFFAYFVWKHAISPQNLLVFTLLLGVGAAFTAPAWQSLIPGTVPKSHLSQAIALGSININLSRAIGPAIAGILVTHYGMPAPFAINALSFVAIIVATLLWKQTRSNSTSTIPPEKVWRAIRAGIRFSLFSKPLQVTMLHAFGFMFFANAFWGLIPVIAKETLQGDAAFFASLMTAIGAGGIVTGLFLPNFKRWFKVNVLVMIGSFGTAVVTAYFDMVSSQWQALAAGFVFGISWVLVLSSVNISAQHALPDWVRARGLAVFMMVFFGGISLGSTFWGWVASLYSVSVALNGSAIGAVIFQSLTYRLKLQQGGEMDLTPSLHWPVPMAAQTVGFDQGPVMVTICYQVNQEDKQAFLRAIYRLKAVRLRNGVYRWGVFENAETPGQYLEYFIEDNWAEHLRHHERLPKADKILQDRVVVFHQGREPPKVTHHISADMPFDD